MTEQQKLTLRFIREYIDQHGHSPAYRDISKGIGLKSVGQIRPILTQLQNLGKIRFIAGRHRSVEIVQPWEVRVKSILDRYDGGRIGPTEAIECVREIATATEAFQ
jgi:SOS-response transcriptional repressor LexA